MTPPVGVILAGGQARRMGGGDKGLLAVDGASLLDHVIARAKPQLSHMAINANGDADRFSEFGLPVIADSIEGFVGPLAGVLAGMDWAAATGQEFVVTVAADTPFFPDNLVETFLQAADANAAQIVLAATPDPKRGTVRHPTFGLWSVALREDLRAALKDGVRKVVMWTDQYPSATAIFDTKNGDPFFNVNTPDDLERAKIVKAGLVG